MKTIDQKWKKIRDLEVLELFGYDGSFHTRDYFHKVGSLEIWEIDQNCYDALCANLPGAKIKIVDTFSQIKITPNLYDIVVIDNPTSTYGSHCEHFSLFPDVLKVLKDDGILIVNVIPKIEQKDLMKMPYLFNKEQLIKREKFYKTNNPINISIDQMVYTYSCIAKDNEIKMLDYFSVKRSFVYYLVMRFQKNK